MLRKAADFTLAAVFVCPCLYKLLNCVPNLFNYLWGGPPPHVI
jgi:hypothetical protein